MSTFEEAPVPNSEYGARVYDEGRRLVEECELFLDEIVWDADEVLWDWLMNASRILVDVGDLVRRDIGHCETIMPKPGIFELLWGMRHASVEKGAPAHMRIWTDGYPWRLWRIAAEIPGFDELVGPPADASDGEWESFQDHPRIFSRVDFVQVAKRLEWPGARRRLLAPYRASARAVIAEQFRRDPYESNLKIPELADLAGKPEFETVGILVDNRRDNVARFVATDRRGVHAVSHTPRVLFGTVPNTVWRAPKRVLAELDNNTGKPVADALREVASAEAPAMERAEPLSKPADYPTRQFEIDIPDDRLRAEWIEPMRELRDRGAFGGLPPENE